MPEKGRRNALGYLQESGDDRREAFRDEGRTDEERMGDDSEDGLHATVSKYWRSMMTRTKRQRLVDIINVRL